MQKIQKLMAEAREYMSKGRDAEPEGLDYYYRKISSLANSVQGKCNMYNVMAQDEIEELLRNLR